MPNHKILRIREHEELVEQAATWFHQKWGVPRQAYTESMRACLQKAAVPQWFVVMDGQKIIAGAGVIENDFHNRRDLAPNLCALYVEEDCRNRGIAGALLRFACEDMAAMGTPTLYLVTDHTTFYERYGWTFLCMVQDEAGQPPARMYRHQA